MNQTLVAYFSASGVTAKAAEVLAKTVRGDLYEIKPAAVYTREDLNWQDKYSRSSREMQDPGSRPEIAGKKIDMEGYHRIFLGFPIWWYTAPKIICSFLESYDFAGKTIILFATSEGSGFGKTVQTLSALCPGAVIKEGGMLNGKLSEESLKSWADKK